MGREAPHKWRYRIHVLLVTLLATFLLNFLITSPMHQVVLEIAGSRKVHVISEHATKEDALDKYIKLVEANKGSPVTSKGKYTIRKKPE